jgi:hypothetical protein
MDTRKLELLAKLGLLEVFQSYLEGDEEYDSYYWREVEEIEDEFFKKDMRDLEE